MGAQAGGGTDAGGGCWRRTLAAWKARACDAGLDRAGHPAERPRRGARLSRGQQQAGRREAPATGDAPVRAGRHGAARAAEDVDTVELLLSKISARDDPCLTSNHTYPSAWFCAAVCVCVWAFGGLWAVRYGAPGLGAFLWPTPLFLPAPRATTAWCQTWWTLGITVGTLPVACLFLTYGRPQARVFFYRTRGAAGAPLASPPRWRWTHTVCTSPYGSSGRVGYPAASSWPLTARKGHSPIIFAKYTRRVFYSI